MSATLAHQAGSAFIWRALQMLAGKIIQLARWLILARLLTPDDFGLFAIAFISLQLVLSVTEFGMGRALVQRMTAEDTQYDVAWSVGLLRAALVSLFVVGFAPQIAAMFGEPRAVGVIRIIAIAPLITAFGSIRVVDLERDLKFRTLALLDLPALLVSAVLAIALAPALGVWALVTGALAGSLIGTTLSYVVAPYRPRFILSRDAAEPLFRFGRWIFVSGIIAVAGDTVLRAVVARQLGTDELGRYFMAATLALLPNDVLSGIVGSVAFPVHARVQRDLRRVALVFRASIIAMAVVLLPLYAALIVLAPTLVLEVLGPQWVGTEHAIQLLAVAGTLGIAFDATAPMLEGRGEPHKVTALQFSVAATTIGLAWFLAGRFGLPGAALAWVLAQCVMCVVCAFFVRQLLPHPIRGLVRPLLAISVVAAATAGTALLLDHLLSGVAGLAATTVVATLVGTMLLIQIDRRLEVGLMIEFTQAFPSLALRLQELFSGARAATDRMR